MSACKNNLRSIYWERKKKDLKEEEEEKPIVCKFLLIFPGFDVCLCESSNNNLSCYSHFN